MELRSVRSAFKRRMENALGGVEVGGERSLSASVVPEDPKSRKQLFLRLVRASEPTMLRVARRLCRGSDDAEDVVQDAIVSAYRAFMAGKFEDVHNFRPWILRILKNTFLQGERSKRRWVFAEGKDLDEVPLAGPAPPVDPQLGADLEAALRALNADQRACVEMVYFEQLDYAETAAVLGVPIGTVRSRLARARFALYESMLEFERSRSEP